MVVYIEEDFTLTTTGNLTSNNLTTDELGGGWVGNPAAFNYQGDSSGLNANSSGSFYAAFVHSDNREDVRVEWSGKIERGAFNGRWPGIAIRSINSTYNGASTMSVVWNGVGGATAPTLILWDGRSGDTQLKEWDLNALMVTAPVESDDVDIVLFADGNDITLHSVAVNGGSAEVLDNTYTLTGATATAHGAGSGADYYGIISHRADTTQRHRWFSVSSLTSPAVRQVSPVTATATAQPVTAAAFEVAVRQISPVTTTATAEAVTAAGLLAARQISPVTTTATAEAVTAMGFEVAVRQVSPATTTATAGAVVTVPEGDAYPPYRPLRSSDDECTNTRWSLTVIDRQTRRPFCTLSPFSGTVRLELNASNLATLTVALDGCCNCSSQIRSIGHWAYLRNHDDDEASILGPITTVAYDLQAGEVSITVVDWMQLVLEDLFLVPYAKKGNLIEIAKDLLAISHLELGYTVESYPAPAQLEATAVVGEPISRWWRTLTLSGMDWVVRKDRLVLGDNPTIVTKLTNGSFEDNGLQVDFDDSIYNVIVVAGEGGLTHVYPSAYSVPETDRDRFFGHRALLVNDPNVTTKAQAAVIGERVYAERSQGAPVISSNSRALLPWRTSKPGQRVNLDATLCGDKSVRQPNNRITNVIVDIVDNEEVNRQIRLGAIV